LLLQASTKTPASDQIKKVEFVGDRRKSDLLVGIIYMMNV